MGPQNGGVVDSWSLFWGGRQLRFYCSYIFPVTTKFHLCPYLANGLAFWSIRVEKIVLFLELLPLELMGRNGRDEGEHWSMAATSIEFYLHHFLICSQSYPVHVLLSGGSRIQVYLVAIVQLALRRGESGDIGLRHWKFSGEKFHQHFSSFFIQKLNGQISLYFKFCLILFWRKKISGKDALKMWVKLNSDEKFLFFFVR